MAQHKNAPIVTGAVSAELFEQQARRITGMSFDKRTRLWNGILSF